MGQLTVIKTWRLFPLVKSLQTDLFMNSVRWRALWWVQESLTCLHQSYWDNKSPTWIYESTKWMQTWYGNQYPSRACGISTLTWIARFIYPLCLSEYARGFQVNDGVRPRDSGPFISGNFEPNLSWSLFCREIWLYEIYQLQSSCRKSGMNWTTGPHNGTQRRFNVFLLCGIALDIGVHFLVDRAFSPLNWQVRDLKSYLIPSDFCHVFISCTWYLNNWKEPDVPGLYRFKGQLLYTAKWDETCNYWVGNQNGICSLRLDWSLQNWNRVKGIVITGKGSSGILQVLPACFLMSCTLITIIYVRGARCSPTFSRELLDERSPYLDNGMHSRSNVCQRIKLLKYIISRILLLVTLSPEEFETFEKNTDTYQKLRKGKFDEAIGQNSIKSQVILTIV